MYFYFSTLPSWAVSRTLCVQHTTYTMQGSPIFPPSARFMHEPPSQLFTHKVLIATTKMNKSILKPFSGSSSWASSRKEKKIKKEIIYYFFFKVLHRGVETVHLIFIWCTSSSVLVDFLDNISYLNILSFIDILLFFIHNRWIIPPLARHHTRHSRFFFFFLFFFSFTHRPDSGPNTAAAAHNSHHPDAVHKLTWLN